MKIKSMIISAMMLISSLCFAQGKGTWLSHPIVGSAPTALIDGDNFVYMLIKDNLYRYDEENDEMLLMGKQNYLNDAQVTGIYYNFAKKYLVVTYLNSNIDIIKKDGDVINMPDIKDAIITNDKTINNVTFANGKIYVATGFGYVAFDENKFEVKESRILNTNISSALEANGVLVLSAASDTYYVPLAKSHTSISHFSTLGATLGTLYPLSNNTFVSIGSSVFTTYSASINAEGNAVLTSIVATNGKATCIQPNPASSDTYAFVGAINTIYNIAPNGETVTPTTLSDGVKNTLLSTQKTDGSWWNSNEKGLRKVKLSGATIETLKDFIKLQGTTVPLALGMAYNKNIDKLYVHTVMKNYTYFSDPGFSLQETVINTYDGSSWEVKSAPKIIAGTQSRCYGNIFFYPSNDPNRYFVSVWQNGIYEVKDDVMYRQYREASKTGSYTTFHAQPDSKGNIWSIPWGESNYRVYTKDFIENAAPGQNYTTGGIKTKEIIPHGATWMHTMRIAKKNDLKIFWKWADKIQFALEKSDDLETADFDYKAYSSFIDQDGKSYAWYDVYDIVSDNNGMVWLGTLNGVVYFDPTKVFDDDFHVYRPKVPRNDGTSSADYLLDGIRVNKISVDAQNRKWIATNSAGLFCVSADGKEIIEEHNTDNSILPSNLLYSVCCNTKSGSVFVGPSTGGVYEYQPSSDGGGSSYSNVYAYPNPVRPEYTGYITITGLMNNSLVKITDAAGKVITQLTSTGDTVQWNGCNEQGQRVGTGVYLVLASHSVEGAGEAVVSKIMIVR